MLGLVISAGQYSLFQREQVSGFKLTFKSRICHLNQTIIQSSLLSLIHQFIPENFIQCGVQIAGLVKWSGDFYQLKNKASPGLFDFFWIHENFWWPHFFFFCQPSLLLSSNHPIWCEFLVITVLFIKTLGFSIPKTYCYYRTEFLLSWNLHLPGGDTRAPDVSDVLTYQGLAADLGLSSRALCPILSALCPCAGQTHSPVSKGGRWETCELELFTSQLGITTPPSDELSANESEPDGQIFLKTTYLKSGGVWEKFLVKLSMLCDYISWTVLFPAFGYCRHYHLEKMTC